MKLIVRGTSQLHRTFTLTKNDPPLGVLAEIEGVHAELTDDTAVCFRRAEFKMNGAGWVCVMDRTGELGPRPDSVEKARELPIDMTMVLCELARRDRRSRRWIKLPDWDRVVMDLVTEGYLQVVEGQGKLTQLGRIVGMDLIDMGY